MDGNVTENQTLNNLKGKIVVIPTVDPTLTKDGFAADAKVVGDKLTEWELLNAPVDNLDSESTARPLSANQGRVLKEMIEGAGAVPEDVLTQGDVVDHLLSEAGNLPLSANQGRRLAEEVEAVNESLMVDTTNLSEDFSLNGLLQMLAERYFPNAEYIFKEGVGYCEGYSAIQRSGYGTVTTTSDKITISGNGSTKGQIILDGKFTNFLDKSFYIDCTPTTSIVELMSIPTMSSNITQGGVAGNVTGLTPNQRTTISLKIGEIFSTTNPYLLMGTDGVSSTVIVHNMYIK